MSKFVKKIIIGIFFGIRNRHIVFVVSPYRGHSDSSKFVDFLKFQFFGGQFWPVRIFLGSEIVVYCSYVLSPYEGQISSFSIFWGPISACLDPDPLTQLNPDPKHCLIL
jgi:hypothetical protein